jgi:hypothetical protein
MMSQVCYHYAVTARFLDMLGMLMLVGMILFSDWLLLM